MTEAMPFLQKAILLSYDPRPFPPGDFLCGKPHVAGTLVKTNTLDRAGNELLSAPDFCIFASPPVLLPVFCEEHMLVATPAKGKHLGQRRRLLASLL